MLTRTYLEDQAAFSPEEIEVMSKALLDACRALQIDGQAKDRETIAARIIELARRGVIDAMVLRRRGGGDGGRDRRGASR